MIQILSKVNTVTSTNSTEQIDTLKTLPLNFDIPGKILYNLSLIYHHFLLFF